MKQTSAPTLTPEQRAAALEKAREARARRSEIAKGLASGEMKFSELLKTDEPAAAKMKVSAAIKAMPGYGTAKTDALLAELGIAEGRRIGGLGSRQRAALIEIFG